MYFLDIFCNCGVLKYFLDQAKAAIAKYICLTLGSEVFSMFLNDTGINLLSVSGILDCDHLARVDPHPEGQGLHGRGI